MTGCVLTLLKLFSPKKRRNGTYNKSFSLVQPIYVQLTRLNLLPVAIFSSLTMKLIALFKFMHCFKS